MDELRTAFERFDTDGSGHIEVDELDELLAALDLDTGDDAVLKAMSKLQTESPGRVTWEELRVWWDRHGSRATARDSATPGGMPDEEKLRHLFERFDSDGSGYIEVDELSDLLQAANLAPHDEQVVAALQQFDDSGDGRLSWEEFVGWWNDLLGAR